MQRDLTDSIVHVHVLIFKIENPLCVNKCFNYNNVILFNPVHVVCGLDSGVAVPCVRARVGLCTHTAPALFYLTPKAGSLLPRTCSVL